jgi:3-hydroxyisobutyrate dehydrogenase-like beta-hydroxyacid dehydrogenase
MTRIAFIGIGRMGLPMAMNLLAAGHAVTVFNRASDRCAPLLDHGAAVAGSPAEAARDAEIVITMVADGAAARDVLLGHRGAIAALGAGGIAVDMSTIGPTAATELAAAAVAAGATFLDAPVSGSVSLAEAGELTTMVGGDTESFERARPVLAAMTKTQFHLGPSGTGSAMKLALNAVIALTAEALGECLVLAQRAGISPTAAYDVLQASAVASPFVAYKRAAFLEPESAPAAFTVSLMQKDLALALELAGRVGAHLPATAAAAQVLALASSLGYADEDFARVASALEASG